MPTSTRTRPDIPIVYEDHHLLIVEKPENVLSQKDHTGDPDVLTLCKEYIKREMQKTGNVYLGLVHRLDRPVGGVMMLAKTSKAAQRLSRQMKDRVIQKTYWAVVHGPVPENGVLTHHLVKDRQRNVVKAVSSPNRQAKEAMLSFQRLETAGKLSLIAVNLHTGRPHQIRVQLSSERHPIWGDYKYGSPGKDGKSIALWAVELSFRHPATGKIMTFTCPPALRKPWAGFQTVNEAQK